MTVKEICERLTNVESITNERVYIVDYDNYNIRGYELIGFNRVNEGDYRGAKYVYYATLELYFPEKPLRVKIEDVYCDEDSAKKALNNHIQGLINNLEIKKL